MHALTAFALTIGLVTAQARTWVVDAANGPGTDFLDLPPAIAASGIDDLILVRAGSYSEFRVDHGVRILGQGLVRCAGVDVGPVPGGQTLALTNLEVTARLFVGGIAVRGATGLVLLQDLRIPAGPLLSLSRFPGLVVRDAASVIVTGGSYYGVPAVQVVDSTLSLCGTELTGDWSSSFLGGTITTNSPGLRSFGSRVLIARSRVTGGNGASSLFLTREGQPGIDAQSSDLTIAGSTDMVVTAGRRAGGTPTPAVLANGGAVTVDTHAVLYGFDAPPIDGTATITWRRTPALVLSGGALGGTLSLDATCPYGGLMSFLVSTPTTATPLPPLGTLFLDRSAMFDALVSILNGERATASFTVPNLGALQGVTLGFQAIHAEVSGGTVALSNPAIAVLR
ncbi:MAG: hypothetical protein IPM29_22825 [Planctomycetes bacterium]|nr:hypothetical protein [Planctomycetota bacterium]